jgi:hypothetical protein
MSKRGIRQFIIGFSIGLFLVLPFAFWVKSLTEPADWWTAASAWYPSYVLPILEGLLLFSVFWNRRMKAPMSNNWVSYGMIMLGALMVCSNLGSILLCGYCLLTWTFPSLGMIGFFVWTAIISVATWRLDAHLLKKEKNPIEETKL